MTRCRRKKTGFETGAVYLDVELSVCMETTTALRLMPNEERNFPRGPSHGSGEFSIRTCMPGELDSVLNRPLMKKKANPGLLHLKIFNW
jgi:hypothetical protein